MIGKDAPRKDPNFCADEAAAAFRDENCTMPHNGVQDLGGKPTPNAHPTEAAASGWGLKILKQQEQRGISQRRVHSKGSFVDLISDKVLSELTLRDVPDEESTSSSTISSTDKEVKGSVNSIGSSARRIRPPSSRASSSSFGSSGESSDTVDGYFDEDTEELSRSGGDQSSVTQRTAYKRGLSQRRIKGSTEKPSEETAVMVSAANLAEVCGSTTRVDAEEVQRVQLQELFAAVKTKDEQTVKTLHSAGVSLESVEKNAMTPLIMACLDGSLIDMVRTLISLGANVQAYRSGIHAGYPLHHAAKRGHEHVVGLLLSSGAEALAVNDDGQTALDIARIRGHASVVRVIEDWISLFKGILRIITDNAGSQIMKRTWAVVLPSEANLSVVPRRELVLYNSRKVPMPESVILLGSVTSEFVEPDYSSSDPSLIITDKVTKTKFKFFSHEHGDKKQIAEFYRACKGISQEKNRLTRSSTTVPETAEIEEQRMRCRRSSSENVTRSTENTIPPSSVRKNDFDTPKHAPIPRSKSDKPSSRKNLIYPEESLSAAEKLIIRHKQQSV